MNVKNSNGEKTVLTEKIERIEAKLKETGGVQNPHWPTKTPNLLTNSGFRGQGKTLS